MRYLSCNVELKSSANSPVHFSKHTKKIIYVESINAKMYQHRKLMLSMASLATESSVTHKISI